MNAVTTIVLILLVVIAVIALVRMMAGAGGVVGPTTRPLPPTERVVEREVEQPPTQRVVIETDVPPERL